MIMYFTVKADERSQSKQRRCKRWLKLTFELNGRSDFRCVLIAAVEGLSSLNTHILDPQHKNPEGAFGEFIIVTLWFNAWVTFQRCLTRTQPDVWRVSYLSFFTGKQKKGSIVQPLASAEQQAGKDDVITMTDPHCNSQAHLRDSFKQSETFRL